MVAVPGPRIQKKLERLISLFRSTPISDRIFEQIVGSTHVRQIRERIVEVVSVMPQERLPQHSGRFIERRSGHIIDLVSRCLGPLPDGSRELLLQRRGGSVQRGGVWCQARGAAAAQNPTAAAQKPAAADSAGG